MKCIKFRPCDKHGEIPSVGCVHCEAMFDDAVQQLSALGFTTPATRASRRLAQFVLAYAAEEHAQGAGLGEHLQVWAALERGARWFAHHEHVAIRRRA